MASGSAPATWRRTSSIATHHFLSPPFRRIDVEVGGLAQFRLSGERTERTGTVVSVTGHRDLAQGEHYAVMPLDEPSTVIATIAMPLDEPSTVIATIAMPRPESSPQENTAQECLMGRSARVLLPATGGRRHRSNPAPRGSGGLHRAAATAEHARFAAKEQAVLRKEGQADSICTMTDISLGGAQIAGSPPAWARNGEEGVLLLNRGALRVPFRFIGLDRWQDFGRGFPIVFEAGIPLRRTLTARLFGGAYRGAIDDIDVPRVIFALGKRLVR